jgi:3-deoxy-7-phosphoheptulonate synthase
MIVVMERGATEEQVERVIERLIALEFSVHRSTGEVHTILGGIGPDEVAPETFEVLDGVKECYRIVSPYKLAARAFRPEGTSVTVGSHPVGCKKLAIGAAVSRVESEAQASSMAAFSAGAGAGLLQCGLRPAKWEEDLELSRRVASAHGLALTAEAKDTGTVKALAGRVDCVRIGGRNMQNDSLLEAAGASGLPVILDRHMAATVDEWLMAAEIVLKAGNYQVILCERGIRTFEAHSRLTVDVSGIAEVKRISHLPVIADPSKATGRRDRVLPMARAAVAAGADGLIIEVHPDAESADLGGPQALLPAQFIELMEQVAAIAAAVGRSR